MTLRLLLPALIGFALLNCQSRSAGSASDTGADSPAPTRPSLPPERIRELAERCDYIDYLFYYANFSLSQDQPGAIRQTVSFIGPGTEPTPGCRPMGRIFFQEKGEILLEGDMYFGEGCRYFLFYENGKPKYLHAMTPLAINFLNQVFQQARQSPYGSE